MKRIRYGRIAAIVTAGALALTACGNDPATTDSGSSNTGGDDAAAASDLSGTLAGSGATSQESAQNAWIAKFGEVNPDVDLSYDPVGSGGGRKAFIEGGVGFAGSDAALTEEERGQAKEKCGADAYDLPLYISPIAVVYNLPSVKSLQLSSATIAKIFDGKITTWNDPAIAADNPGATLPSSAITPINRSDESGTTKNFTDYLSKTAPADWTYKPDGNWPKQGTQSANGTSGVVQAVEAAEGTIAYADHSKAGSLGVAKIKVGEKYVEPTAEGAAKVVEESPKVEGLPEHDLAIDIKRDITTDGSYPLLLVSYIVVCSKYSDAAQGKLVKAYVSYIASEDGQKVAAEEAGSAPISASLRTDVEAAIKAIS